MKAIWTALLLCSALFAAGEVSIDALIADIVNAPPQERYEKMNAFKRKMRQLNAEERARAIETLRAKAYPSAGGPAEGTRQAHRMEHRGDRSPEGMQQMRMQQQQYQMRKGGGMGNGRPPGNRPRRPSGR